MCLSINAYQADLICFCRPVAPLTSLDMSDSYLAEINGENLQLFGPGSLDSLDKSWGEFLPSRSYVVRFHNV